MFQVYLPCVQTHREQALAAAGLGDMLPDAFWTDGPGPDGGHGVFASWRPPGQTCRSGYAPEAQRWLPAVAANGLPAGRYWVGLWTNETLTPSRLARRRTQGGTWRALTPDGEPWLIPRVEAFPRAMRVCDDGLFLQVIAPLRPFADWAATLAQRIERSGSLPQREMFEFCAAALRLNYALTPELIGELELVTTETAIEITKAVLGMTP